MSEYLGHCIFNNIKILKFLAIESCLILNYLRGAGNDSSKFYFFTSKKNHVEEKIIQFSKIQFSKNSILEKIQYNSIFKIEEPEGVTPYQILPVL